MQGRTECGVKVIVPNQFVPSTLQTDDAAGGGDAAAAAANGGAGGDQLLPLSPGDYVAVEIVDANSQSLHGIPLFHTNLRGFQTNFDQFRQFRKEKVAIG